MTIGDTDVVPADEEDALDHRHRYGFWATLVGLPLHERRLLKRIERIVAVNTAALTEALASLQETGEKLDNISPTEGDPSVH